MRNFLNYPVTQFQFDMVCQRLDAEGEYDVIHLNGFPLCTLDAPEGDREKFLVKRERICTLTLMEGSGTLKATRFSTSTAQKINGF
jgi:hypothetical protein